MLGAERNSRLPVVPGRAATNEVSAPRPQVLAGGHIAWSLPTVAGCRVSWDGRMHQIQTFWIF